MAEKFIESMTTELAEQYRDALENVIEEKD
jgi:hypothetical protein